MTRPSLEAELVAEIYKLGTWTPSSSISKHVGREAAVAAIRSVLRRRGRKGKAKR